MPIDALPTPPSRTDPVNFRSRADAFLAKLSTFATQATALETNVNSLEAAAVAALNAAISVVGAVKWVSGTIYTAGTSTVWSPGDYMTYRRKTNGAGTTDPSLDPTNWVAISVVVNSPVFTGTSQNVNINFSGTLTGGSGVVNIGAGQLYKDANGNFGINTTSPSGDFHLVSVDAGALYIERTGSTTGKYRIGINDANNQLEIYDSVGGGVRLAIDGSGNLCINTTTAKAQATVNGNIATSVPPSPITTTTYTVSTTDSSLIFNTTATCTVTLPAAASYAGRWLTIKSIAAYAINSASTNVKPIGSNSAGTAILTATAGKWADLQSDGTNWIIMRSN